jgi:hypothetical protein
MYNSHGFKSAVVLHQRLGSRVSRLSDAGRASAKTKDLVQVLCTNKAVILASHYFRFPTIDIESGFPTVFPLLRTALSLWSGATIDLLESDLSVKRFYFHGWPMPLSITLTSCSAICDYARNSVAVACDVSKNAKPSSTTLEKAVVMT